MAWTRQTNYTDTTRLVAKSCYHLPENDVKSTWIPQQWCTAQTEGYICIKKAILTYKTAYDGSWSWSQMCHHNLKPPQRANNQYYTNTLLNGCETYKTMSTKTTYFMMYLAFSRISVYALISRGCDTRLSCFHWPYNRYLHENHSSNYSCLVSESKEVEKVFTNVWIHCV